MLREAVDEVVLAAVGLVGDDDDVPTVREHGVLVALLLGEELLDCGEDDAACLDGELAAKVCAESSAWRRWLAKQVLASREGAEELVVEVVPIGEHDDGRILHRLFAGDPARRRRPW